LGSGEEGLCAHWRWVDSVNYGSLAGEGVKAGSVGGLGIESGAVRPLGGRFLGE